jgi:hypothetical protein
MTAKMNWDRVRKESQSRRSGIDWIGQDSSGSKLDQPRKQVPTKSKDSKKFVPNRKIITGCTCKKTLGFKGEHKQSCALKRQFSPTLEHFAETIRRVDQRCLLANALSSLLGDVYRNQNVREQDRKEAQILIRFLQDQLTGTGRLKPEMDTKIGSSGQAKLMALLRLRENVYLRAENKDAVHALRSAATELGLKLYQFQCSIRTIEKDLSGFSRPQKDFHPTAMGEAFTKGGLFCVESIEKAPFNFQFWLKDWLTAASLGMDSSVTRHPDFAIVVTSPTPMRDLCSGRIDPAFMDCLAYLDLISGGPSSTPE